MSWWHLSRSAISQQLRLLFLPNFLGGFNFSGPKLFWKKLLQTNNLFRAQNIFEPQFYWTQNFSKPKMFWTHYSFQKFSLEPKFFSDPQLYWTRKKIRTNFLSPTFSVNMKYFQTQVFWDPKFSSYPTFSLDRTQNFLQTKIHFCAEMFFDPQVFKP